MPGVLRTYYILEFLKRLSDKIFIVKISCENAAIFYCYGKLQPYSTQQKVEREVRWNVHMLLGSLKGLSNKITRFRLFIILNDLCFKMYTNKPGQSVGDAKHPKQLVAKPRSNNRAVGLMRG